MKPKRRVILIAVALVPSLLLIVLAELGLRWYERYSVDSRIRQGDSLWNASTTIHKKSDDATLIYELNPGSEATRDGVRIKINSAGFRDDEFPEQGLSAGQRIVLLGDSVAWGWGVQMTAAFPQLLESRLRKANVDGDSQPVVYNLAVDGYSTEQELRLLEVRGLALQPDLVIISYVLNDPDTADGGLARYYTSGSMLLRAAESAMNRIYGILDPDSNLNEYHHRIHAYYEEQIGDHFRELGRISEDNDIPIVIVVTPVFSFEPGEPYGWQSIHDSIERLAEQNGLAFVDSTSSFRGKHSSEFSFDQWHPNEGGHAILARVLADYVLDFSSE